MQFFSPIAEALSQYLDLSSLQLKVTAQNMANVDTPGYQTMGFDFAGAMHQCLTEVSGNGGEPSAERPSPLISRTGGLLERPDGNDVSMEREGLNMAAAQLQFRTGVALLRQEFTRTMDAIHVDEK